MSAEQIYYSEKYFDEEYEYKHVILPPVRKAKIVRRRVMTTNLSG